MAQVDCSRRGSNHEDILNTDKARLRHRRPLLNTQSNSGRVGPSQTDRMKSARSRTSSLWRSRRLAEDLSSKTDDGTAESEDSGRIQIQDPGEAGSGQASTETAGLDEEKNGTEEGDEDNDEDEDSDDDDGNGDGDDGDDGDDNDDDDDDDDDDGDEFEDATSGTDTEAGWERESMVKDDEDDEDGGLDEAISGLCVFCGQDELHDPSDEFEEYLACQQCGQHAHRQCARDQDAFDDDLHTDGKWTCLRCPKIPPNHMRESPDDEDFQDVQVSEEHQDGSAACGLDGALQLNGAVKLESKGAERSSRKRKIGNDDDGEGDDDLVPPPSQKRRLADDGNELEPDLGQGPETEPATPAVTSSTDTAPTLAGGRSSARKARANAALVLALAASARPRKIRAAAAAAAATVSSLSHPISTPRGSTFTSVSASPPRVQIVEQTATCLIVALRLNPTKLAAITLSQNMKRRAGGPAGTRAGAQPGPIQQPGQFLPFGGEEPHYPSIQLNLDSVLYDMVQKGDLAKTKPYGGVLTPTEADTSKTFPHYEDRKLFEDARLRAEAAWQAKVKAAEAAEAEALAAAEQEKAQARAAEAGGAAAVAVANGGQRQSGPGAGSTAATPAARRRQQQQQQRNRRDSRQNQDRIGQPCKIKCINFGGYEIETWHAAPYPEEYTRNRVLYICEFCLKYMSSDYVAWRHKLKCPDKHPPGDEIYRDGDISFFEVDGRKNPVYCQNLCLLSKLFLGSKTLYYDVEPFLFYIMTVTDEYGCHLVGYFSKEKRAGSSYNVSCILVLPIYQRRGFGHLLIDFSYLLSRVENKVGSPEKPLSDMGLVSYRGYWRLVLAQQLLRLDGKTGAESAISVSDLSSRTGMTADDVVSGLEGLRALVRDPVTGEYALAVDYSYLKDYVRRHEAKKWPALKPGALVWAPYVMNVHGPADEDGDGEGEDGDVDRVGAGVGVPPPEFDSELQAGALRERFMFDDRGEPIVPSIETAKSRRTERQSVALAPGRSRSQGRGRARGRGRSHEPTPSPLRSCSGTANGVGENSGGATPAVSPGGSSSSAADSGANPDRGLTGKGRAAGEEEDEDNDDGQEGGEAGSQDREKPVPWSDIPLSRYELFPSEEVLAGLVPPAGARKGGLAFGSMSDIDPDEDEDGESGEERNDEEDDDEGEDGEDGGRTTASGSNRRLSPILRSNVKARARRGPRAPSGSPLKRVRAGPSAALAPKKRTTPARSARRGAGTGTGIADVSTPGAGGGATPNGVGAGPASARSNKKLSAVAAASPSGTGTPTPRSRPRPRTSAIPAVVPSPISSAGANARSSASVKAKAKAKVKAAAAQSKRRGRPPLPDHVRIERERERRKAERERARAKRAAERALMKHEGEGAGGADGGGTAGVGAVDAAEREDR